MRWLDLHRILKVYTEALTSFSHIYNPDGLKNTLFSQDYILGTAHSVGMASGTHIPRTGEDMRSLQLPSPAHGATCSHCLPYDLHQHSCTAGGSINWKNVSCCPIKVNKSILDGPWAHSWVYNACTFAFSNAYRMFGAALFLKAKIGSPLRAFRKRMDKYKLEYYTTEKMKE